MIPTKPGVQYWEQSINNVILLKQYIKSVPAVFDALTGVKSKLLKHISIVGQTIYSEGRTDNAVAMCSRHDRRLSKDNRCGDQRGHHLSEPAFGLEEPADICYQGQFSEGYRMRPFTDTSFQSGVNGLLDVARQTYKEANADAFQMISDLGGTMPISSCL